MTADRDFVELLCRSLRALSATNHVLAESEFIEYSGGNNLEPSQPGDEPLSFNPTQLIADYDSRMTDIQSPERPPSQAVGPD